MRAIGSVIFGLLVAVASTPLVAGTSPGKAVDALQDAYRNGSVDGMLAAYSADATFEDINQRHRFEGTEQLRLLLGHIVGMHLTMDLVESRRVIDGDTVVVEYEYRGRLDGAALGASVGKEGCPDLEYVLPATSWYTVRGGEIVEQKDFIDWATFLELRQQMLAAGTDASGHGSR